MKNKRIFYLRTDIYNETLRAGGSVTHTLGVIEGFLKHNYSMIIASTIMKELLEALSPEAFYQLRSPKFLSWMRWKLNCFFSTFFFLFQSLSILKKSSPIDYMYQRYSILNATGVLLSKIKKIPLILEYNGSEVWVDTFWSTKRFFKLRWIIQVIELFNLRYCYKIVVVSDALKNELLSRGIDRQKIMVIPNGVNTTQFNPQLLGKERIGIREKLKIQDYFVFGFIGTFNQWHGIELLIRIIPKIHKLNNRSRFLLIGNGPLLNTFTQTLDPTLFPYIICTGLIPQEEAKNYLAACDAFLCPTQPNPDDTPFFGSPTKVFEYLSMAKPIIASDIGQLSQIINPALFISDANHQPINTALGVLVPPTRDESFIEAALYIMNLSQEQRDQMGLNARTQALQNYDWHHHVLSIIKELQ